MGGGCISFFLLLFLFSGSACAKDSKQKPSMEPSQQILQNICASDLAQGQLSRVVLYKNLKREIGFYELIPDVTQGPHAPYTFYDDLGRSVLTLPNRPMAQDDPASIRIRDQREKLIKDYREAEAEYCSEIRKKKK